MTRVTCGGATCARGVGVARLHGAGVDSTDDGEGQWAPELALELEEGDALP